MTKEQYANFYVVLDYLPNHIKKMLSALPQTTVKNTAEIRLRVGRPLSLTVKGENIFISNSGNACFLYQHGLFTITQSDVDETFKRMCEYSIYAYSEQINKGYITLKNGCRAGLAASAKYENGKISGFKSISSINIRIAGEYKDCAMPIVDKLCDGLIIAGPPSSGKTTILRDAVRLISCGKCCRQKRVAVIDSRGEIASVVGGEPQYDVGPLTDVLSWCSKSYGIETAIRTLNPEIIAFDEIATEQEADEVISGFFAGAEVITTVHAGSVDELFKRKAALKLIESGVVKNAVFLSGVGNQIISVDLNKQSVKIDYD